MGFGGGPCKKKRLSRGGHPKKNKGKRGGHAKYFSQTLKWNNVLISKTLS